jgi:chaperone modulatory protein CbpM
MMRNEVIKLISGIIVEDEKVLSLVELCRYCSQPAEQIIKMVEQGVIEPIEPMLAYSRWQFSSASLLRVQTARRLQRDLEVNLAGAVLALDLLDEIKDLRQRVAYLQRR